MLRKQVFAALILMLVAIAALGQSPQPEMKGYELYSWKVNNKWHYLLLVGTNRLKNYEEITANKDIQVGDSALKTEFKKLPKGEEVIWMSDGPPDAGKPVAGEAFSLKLPSRKRIEGIIAYCNKLGIKLSLR